jgi:hypothetical protein
MIIGAFHRESGRSTWSTKINVEPIAPVAIVLLMESQNARFWRRIW